MRLVTTSLALLLAGGLMAGNFPARADEPVPVVASFSILGDMVREIGGSHVAVTTLVGPDGDAHVYEPTPSDARAVGSAKLLVINGLQFEGWLPRLAQTAGFKGREVVASAGIEPIAFAGEEEHESHDAHAGHADHADHGGHREAAGGHEGHDHGVDDPHAWQSLVNGALYAENIVKGLSEADPEHAADYRARGDAYIAQIRAMDAHVRNELGAIPEARRKVVTSHDAFGYFGNAYDIRFVAPEGVSTESEASAADVAAIIDQIRREGITAVFVENISNPRLIQRIVEETKAKVGGTLYSDALSGPDGPAPTYLEMLEHNVDEIVAALKTS